MAHSAHPYRALPLCWLSLLSVFMLSVSATEMALSEPTMQTAAPTIDPGMEVARIGGKPIPYSELEGITHGKLAQFQAQYDVKLQQLTLGAARVQAEYVDGELQDLVNKRVLESAAAARKTTGSALLSGLRVPVVTDADLHSFYEAQRVQIGEPFEVARPQIKQLLQKEAEEAAQLHYLQSLRAKYRATISWEPGREHVEPAGPQRGSDDAAVTIVEFSDFQCPYCGRLAPVLKQLAKAHPTDVRIIFRNIPLRSIHPEAGKAAEAGVCAGLQGKFWEMHDIMYSEQNSLSVDALKDKARRLNLDPKQFDDCLDSGRALAAVAADEDAAAKLGLTVTPSSFVNGRFMSGALPLYKWEAIVDDEMRRTAAKNSRP